MTETYPSTASNYGTAPVIPEDNSTLEPTEESKHAVNSVNQALSICWRLIEDWKPGIANQAAITAQLNGQRPRDQSILTNLGRDWLPNINSGVLRNEAGKVPARLWEPIITATYLTAASLPENWPNGVLKTSIFRQKVTDSVRSWRKLPWFVKQLAREVGIFGFGHAVWPDEYNWKPMFVRQDRGFVPMGWEILEDEMPLFMFKYDYQPFELLKIVKRQKKAKVGTWNADAVARAVNSSGPKAQNSELQNTRSYEEMIREASIGWTYEKGYNKIPTYHLFSVDSDGTVSHHIVLASDVATYGAQTKTEQVTAGVEAKFMFEMRGQYKKMSDVDTTVMFDPDDGTVQGSWGAGQMLFDLSLELEKTLNDWFAALKQIAKLKVQAGEGKNPDEIKLLVDDAMMVLVNGTYGGNNAAVSTDPRPFQAIIEAVGQLMREKIGSYIPPIPQQPTDIKAAHLKEKAIEQAEVKNQNFQMWLWQWALVMENIVKRLLNPKTPDKVGKALRKSLLEDLTEEEINLLVNQNQIPTIYEFTDVVRSQRAVFAASKEGNPFYNQKSLQEVQASAAGGASFAEYVLIAGDDVAVELGARRQQQSESSSMTTLGEPIAVLDSDLDWYHMLELRPLLEQTLNAGNWNLSILMLDHYKQHYVGAVSKQSMPKDRINVEKSFIAKAQKAIEEQKVPEEPGFFADQVDPVDEAQAQMASGQVTTSEPTAAPALPESQTSNVGRKALAADIA